MLGFSTLSMAVVAAGQAARAVEMKLPKCPLPCALIVRLAVDERAQGRRLGEKLLVDAAAKSHRHSEENILCCVGVLFDAKHEGAEKFRITV